MRRLTKRMVAWTIASILSMASLAAAQTDDTRGASERPRFLMASAAAPSAKGKAPVLVPVDVNRVPVLTQRLSLDLDDVTLKDALETIATKAKLELVYGDQSLPLQRRVRLKATVITVAGALTDVLLGTGVDVVFNREWGASLVKRGGYGGSAAAPGIVRGSVTNRETKRPIVGADVTLVLKDGTLRTVTGDSGGFILGEAPAGKHAVTVRYVGFVPLTKSVVVDTAPVHVDFALEPKAVKMDELVTTASGLQRRGDLGNSITTIRADSVMLTAPIRNLTDLLVNRVPGLTYQNTTGAPGDPTRMRLRGISSVLRSNDPVVVVDGIRIYAAQADGRSGNLASGVGTSQPNIAAPSPLDQIDPNIIEKIEVFKGPSAATLYGADAANGVIVITTKRGRPGPTRWTTTLSHKRTTQAGQWPEGYYRWGHDQFNNQPRFCTLLATTFGCIADSLVRFQLLNEPDLTVLDKGNAYGASLSASGGNQTLQFAITGSYDDEVGTMKLPAVEVDRFRRLFGRDAPDWMKRPQHYKYWSVSSQVTANVSPTLRVDLFSSLFRSNQEKSTLENNLAALSGTYLDRVTGIYYEPANDFLLGQTAAYLQSYYTRITAATTTFKTKINGNWRPLTWLNANGIAGIDFVPRDDQTFLPAGLSSATDSGTLARGSGQSVVGTFSFQGTVTRPLPWGFLFNASAGANLVTQSIADLASRGSGLVPGTTSITGARTLAVVDRRTSSSVFGWWIEPKITGQRFSLSTGFRLDGGSSYGAKLKTTGTGGLLGLPKLNGSWVISEEPFFPFKSLFSSLRLRGAYGQAQVQPGPADRFRLYRPTAIVGASNVELTDSLGNTQVRPERSTEFEGGFDADLFDNRLSVEFTAFRKLKVDALMVTTLPPSVNGGATTIENIGNILNTGVDVTLRLVPVQHPSVTWSTELSFSSISNKLIKLGRGVVPDPARGLVAGYPVNSRWARPILGYADQNGNNVIEKSEVMVGDSMVYVGRLLPAYTTTLHTDMTLFGGAVGISAGFSYDAGQTQIGQVNEKNWVLTREFFDPTTPHNQQAAVVVSTGASMLPSRTTYGLMQELSTFRFNTFGIAYRAPARVAQFLRMQKVTASVTGLNLGLYSNYRGKDPNVNNWSPGEGIVDTGQLPKPRTWQFSLKLDY